MDIAATANFFRLWRLHANAELQRAGSSYQLAPAPFLPPVPPFVESKRQVVTAPPLLPIPSCFGRFLELPAAVPLPPYLPFIAANHNAQQLTTTPLLHIRSLSTPISAIVWKFIAAHGSPFPPPISAIF